MEAVQSTETNAAVAEKSEYNRSLKRNIGELVMEIKTNGKRVCLKSKIRVLFLPQISFPIRLFRGTKITGPQRSQSGSWNSFASWTWAMETIGEWWWHSTIDSLSVNIIAILSRSLSIDRRKFQEKRLIPWLSFSSGLAMQSTRNNQTI